MDDKKYCINCKWLEAEVQNPLSMAMCTHPAVPVFTDDWVDPVTGHRGPIVGKSPRLARLDKDSCGPEGKYYEEFC